MIHFIVQQKLTQHCKAIILKKKIKPGKLLEQISREYPNDQRTYEKVHKHHELSKKWKRNPQRYHNILWLKGKRQKYSKKDYQHQTRARMWGNGNIHTLRVRMGGGTTLWKTAWKTSVDAEHTDITSSSNSTYNHKCIKQKCMHMYKKLHSRVLWLHWFPQLFFSLTEVCS